MDNMLLSILVIGFPAFTGYVIGRARGYYLGLQDAEQRRMKAFQTLLDSLRDAENSK